MLRLFCLFILFRLLFFYNFVIKAFPHCFFIHLCTLIYSISPVISQITLKFDLIFYRTSTVILCTWLFEFTACTLAKNRIRISIAHSKKYSLYAAKLTYGRNLTVFRNEMMPAGAKVVVGATSKRSTYSWMGEHSQILFDLPVDGS